MSQYNQQINKDGSMQVYVPVDYFKYTGYIPKEQLERFNEDLNQSVKNQTISHPQNDTKSMRSYHKSSKSIGGNSNFKQKILDRLS